MDTTTKAIITCGSLSVSKSMVVFTSLAAVILGILCPDFRYDSLSIFVIQVIRPIIFAVPMILTTFRRIRSNVRQDFIMGVVGLVICDLVALVTVTAESGSAYFSDRLAFPIAIGSFIAQVLALSVVAVGLRIIYSYTR